MVQEPHGLTELNQLSDCFKTTMALSCPRTLEGDDRFNGELPFREAVKRDCLGQKHST